MSTIFTRVRRLGLPTGHYVVTGGSMESHGLRPAQDIDIVVDDFLFQELKANGWPPCRCASCFANGRHLVYKDVEIVTEYWYGRLYHIDTPTLITSADIIQGLPFAKLTELLKWKQAANRRKDQMISPCSKTISKPAYVVDFGL